MLPVEKALDIILNNVSKVGVERMPINEALSRVIAADIVSNENIPSFDNSAMDGYAVNSIETKGSSKTSPVLFELLGEVKAGDAPGGKIDKGKVKRIMTGSPIPKGADSVIMVEDTSNEENTVKVFRQVEKGENVRRAGNNVKKGEVVITKGSSLRPQHIGMLASLGISEVEVSKRPKVAIISTGDELLDVKDDPAPGKLRCSNSYALSGQIKLSGGIPADLGIVNDDLARIKEKILEGSKYDMLITTGGVSMGEYDLVKKALAELGADIKFWKVAMKPGKPFLFSTFNNVPVFSLAGNPVSSMINFEILVKPAIYKMLGSVEPAPSYVEGILEQDVVKDDERRHYIRAVTKWKNGGYATLPTGPQDSNILRSMVMANSLIIMPEEKDFMAKGETVKILMI